MPFTFITFGFDHKHIRYGKRFDKDCVAVVECDDEPHGRSLAFTHFGDKFCFEYFEDHWDASDMRYYPKGYKYVGFGEMDDELLSRLSQITHREGAADGRV